MRLLWIAPFPYFLTNKIQHPAPWIKMLAYRLKDVSDIDLTILSTTSFINTEYEEASKDGIKFIFLKHKNHVLTNELTFFKKRINVVKKYLEKNSNQYDLIHLHGSEHQYHTSASGVDLPKVLSIQGIVSEVAKVIPDKMTVKYVTMKMGSYYEHRDLKKVPNFSCRTHWDSAFIKKVAPDSKIFQIWEMIRPSFFEDHFSTVKNKLLFLGGTQKLKGFEETFIAFNTLLKSSKLKLIIAGNTNDKLIKEAIQKNNLTNIKPDDIEIKGFLNEEEIINLYSQSFCFVHPTYIDNSPNSVCEAQISGLPVIASDVGGVSSLIEHNKTGILTDTQPQNIANSILSLLEDDSLRINISENSRAVARERHDPDTILNDNLEMYRSIVKNA